MNRPVVCTAVKERNATCGLILLPIEALVPNRRTRLRQTGVFNCISTIEVSYWTEYRFLLKECVSNKFI